MIKSARAQQARRELDRKFEAGTLEELRIRPRSGWIGAVRGALGMSQATLASRLGITRSAVHQLESAEQIGGITLSKLSQVAQTLDCELVYALVPRTSLGDTVMNQAYKVAVERLGYVETTMALEAQALGPERTREAIERYAGELVAKGDIWETK